MTEEARCDGCGIAYGTPFWVEAVVADDVWDKISPTGDEGGLLCIACMQGRCVALGITCDVQIMTYRGLQSADTQTELERAMTKEAQKA